MWSLHQVWQWMTGLLQNFILLHVLQKIVLMNWLKVHFLLSIFCMPCVAKVDSVPKLKSCLRSCYNAPWCLGGQCETLYRWSYSVCRRQYWPNIPASFKDQNRRLQLEKSYEIRLDGSCLLSRVSGDIITSLYDLIQQMQLSVMLKEWPHWLFLIVCRIVSFKYLD